jgi:sporulation protein YqfC
LGKPRGSKDRELRKRLAHLLDLPDDLLMDLPRLHLLGNVELTITNHRGVIEYTPARVVVGVSEGQVEVSGEGLSIAHVLPEEIRIVGRISFLCMT